MPQFKVGDIVDVVVFDPNGQNPKVRPVVILRLTETTAFVAAVSSTGIPAVLPASYIALPWRNGGHPRTGLDRPSVVKCDWIAEVLIEQIQSKRGAAPAAKLYAIADYLAHRS